MAEGFVHTVFVDAHWQNTIEGEDGLVGGPYATKAEAVEVVVPKHSGAPPSMSFIARTARSRDATPTVAIPPTGPGEPI